MKITIDNETPPVIRVSPAVKAKLAEHPGASGHVDAPCDHAPAPTWTGTDGVTMRVSDMPTPYLRNVWQLLLRHDLAGRGIGYAVYNELSQRGYEPE